MVGKDGGALSSGIGAGEQLRKVVAVEDVVAQYQRAGGVANELLANDERLRQAFGLGLHGVLQVHAPLAAVAQQLLEAWCVLWGADDQNIAHARQHQGTEWVIDHGLVIHRQQLLAHGQSGGVQACA